MKFAFTAYGPVVANDRMGAAKMANGLIEEIEKRTGQKFTLTIHGPIDHGTPDPRAQAHGHEAGARGEGPHPGDDFDNEASGDGEGDDEGADRLQRAGEYPGAEPKRGRGRPRGSRNGGTEASGKAAQGSERDAERPEGGSRGAEGSRGHDDGRTAQGEGPKRGRADEGARGAGASPSAPVGNRGSDPVEAGVDASIDFNDPEPEPEAGPVLTMSDLNRALTTLFTAMGKGAERKHITKALGDIAGVTQPRDVPEEGYAKVIREVDALTAKYETGKLKLSA